MRPVVVALGLLAACAPVPRYGNFLPEGDGVAGALAQDACRKVSAVIAAEVERVQLVHERQDPFAHRLSACLRKAGYAVWSPRRSSAGAVRIAYVVDRIAGARLLRMTLLADRQRFSRAYRQVGERPQPVGPWTAVGGE